LQGALLVRRCVAKPTELTFYLTHAPEGTTVAELVRVAGTRWSIESLVEQAKGEVGLGHYEVRSWVGWHRHVTLAMLALAYRAAVRRPGSVAPVNLAAALLPPTLPEIRRLLWPLIWTHPPKPDTALRWSAWRRRHQQRARRAHWHRRTRAMPPAPKLRP
jgi:hypothetical protein